MAKTWKYVKPLQSPDLILEFELKAGYKFRDDFKTLVLNYNGGRPYWATIRTGHAMRTVKCFLSFNHGDLENIWDTRDWEFVPAWYIPFAIDDGGNPFCFDRRSDKIIWLDHETGAELVMAMDFAGFIADMYE